MSSLVYKPTQLRGILDRLSFIPSWFLDVGVGVGGEALVARESWPSCSILGLEPSWAAYEACRSFFPGTLLPVAAWMRKTKLEMWAVDTELNGNLFGLETAERAIVQADTLDNLSSTYRPFLDVFLWMDVEYAEPAVLLGSLKLFSEKRIKAVNFENHPPTVAPGKSLFVRDFLTWHGLQCIHEYEHEGGHHWDELWTLQ